MMLPVYLIFRRLVGVNIRPLPKHAGGGTLSGQCREKPLSSFGHGSGSRFRFLSRLPACLVVLSSPVPFL
jgi:hypothetical protein